MDLNADLLRKLKICALQIEKEARKIKHSNTLQSDKTEWDKLKKTMGYVIKDQ